MTAKELRSRADSLDGSLSLLPGCGSSSSAQLQDIKEEDDVPKEESLLPAWSCTAGQDTSVEFDLSKALEIPCSMSSRDNSTSIGRNGSISSGAKENLDANNNNNNNTCNSNGISSPRISLKKKFSNALLNAAESSPVAFPGESSSHLEFEIGTLARPLCGLRSHSGSNAASLQHFLPRAVDGGNAETNINSSNEGHLASFFDSRRPTRKFSTGSSSNSSHSNISLTEEFLHKIPSPRMSFNSRSRSNSNSNLISTSLSLEAGGTTTQTTVMNTPNSSLNNVYSRDLDTKKAPLLRRASSAIMRKNSKRSIINATSGNIGVVGCGTMCGNSASSTPILQSSAFFDLTDAQKTPPKDTFRGSSTEEIDYWPSERSFLHDENDTDTLTYATKLGRDTQINPSIGSKVKRGFSRIMNSSGSMKRVISSNSLVSDSKGQQSLEQQQQQSKQSAQQQPYQPQQQSQPIQQSPRRSQKYTRQSHLEQQERPSLESDMSRGPLAGPLDTEANNSNGSPSGNATPVSASTAMSPKSNCQSNFQSPSNRFAEIQRPTAGLGVDWNPASESMVDTDGDHSSNTGSPSSKKSGVTVDLDKLVKTIPIITVTDDLRTKDRTPIRIQSNISLDQMFMRNGAGARGGKLKNTHTNTNDSKNNDGYNSEIMDTNATKKPEMMSLTDYVRVLVKQQQIEDERLAILERSFGDSGWCSRDDLKNIRSKRVAISKKWAERISYYQGKLDS